MTSKEQVVNSHPIFRAFPDSIKYYDKIKRCNEKGQFQDRFLLISTAGVFILRYRSFPRGYTIRNAIPCVELSSIELGKDVLMICSNSIKIQVAGPQNAKIARMIYIIYETLYSHPDRTINLQIHPDMQEEFDQVEYNYSPKSLPAERFLGALYCVKSSYDEELVKRIYNEFQIPRTKFEFNPKIVANPYLNAICTAVANDHIITDLILRDISMSFFHPYLALIMQADAFTQRIVFINVDFSGKLESIASLFQNHQFSSTEFYYSTCNFSSKECKYFFESFSKYKTEIKILSYKKCKFIPETLDALFQSMLFYSCFHKMEALYFSRILYRDTLLSYLSQIATCGWVMESHHLKTLSVTGSKLLLDQFLPILTEYDTGITNLDFSGSNFISPLQVCFPKTFNQLSIIVLNRCQFSDASIHSLFYCLSSYNDKPLKLEFGHIILNKSTWDQVYILIKDLKIPKINELVWDGNLLTPDFFTFIGNMPSLVSISLNQCIETGDIDTYIPLFLHFFKTHQLRRLSLAGSDNFQFGPKIEPLLKVLLPQESIVSLNISDQAFGSTVMQHIMNLLPSCVRDLSIDGYRPSSPNDFLWGCEEILRKSFIKFVPFPVKDSVSVMSKLAVSDKHNYLKDVNTLRQQFQEKYGPSSVNDEKKKGKDALTNFSSVTTSLPESEPIYTTNTMTISTLAQNMDVMRMTTHYDAETIKIIKECGLVSGSDPAQMVISRIREETSLKNLMNTLEKQQQSPLSK